MLRAAVADDDPVILIESRALYQTKGDVRTGGRLEGLGGARRARSGRDAAIITWGAAVQPSLQAADDLAADGFDVSVLDLRWLAPLDDEAIAEVVAASGGRIVVAHEANVTGGFGAEIVARITAEHFDLLDAPVLRVGTPDVRIPSAPVLQQQLVPGPQEIGAAVRRDPRLLTESGLRALAGLSGVAPADQAACDLQRCFEIVREGLVEPDRRRRHRQRDHLVLGERHREAGHAQQVLLAVDGIAPLGRLAELGVERLGLYDGVLRDRHQWMGRQVLLADVRRGEREQQLAARTRVCAVDRADRAAKDADRVSARDAAYRGELAWRRKET